MRQEDRQLLAQCHGVANARAKAGIPKSALAAGAGCSEGYRRGQGRELDPGKAAPSSPPSASRPGAGAPFAFKIKTKVLFGKQ